MLKKINYAVFTILFICSLALFAKSKKIDYFFEQSADYAVLSPIANKPGCFTLTLNKAQPFIHYISSKPYRMTGMMPADKFYQNWYKGKNSFAKDAPNVSLTGIKLHGEHPQEIVSYELTLSNPIYHKDTNEVTYIAQTLQNENTKPEHHDVTLQNAVVFIDDGWCPGCCCG